MLRSSVPESRMPFFLIEEFIRKGLTLLGSPVEFQIYSLIEGYWALEKPYTGGY